MYILKYGKKDRQINNLEERLQEMTLTWKVEKVEGLKEVVLVEGKLNVIGYDTINAHLDDLKRELHQWYYCNC